MLSFSAEKAPFFPWSLLGLAVVCPLPLIAQDADYPEADETPDSVISQKDELALNDEATVAEALKRRSDLAFDNVRVDGEASNLDLNSISAETIGTLEVLKAVMPDMDADSRGGSLNIRSRPLFLLEDPDLKAGLDWKFHQIFNESELDSRFSYAFPFGPSHRFGARVGLTTDRYLWGTHQVNQTWKPVNVDGETTYVPERMNYLANKEAADDYQIDGTIDFRVTDAFYLFVKGNASRWDSDWYNYRVVYRFKPDEAFDPGNLEDDRIRFENAEILKSFSGFEGRRRDWEWSTGGFYDGEDWTFDYRYRRFFRRYEEPDSFSLDFVQRDVDLLYSASDPDFPRVEIIRGAPLEDAGAYEFEDLNSQEWVNEPFEQSAFMNLKRRYDFWNGSGFFRGGMKWRNKSINRYSGDRIYDRYAGDFRLSDVVGGFRNDDILDGRYTLSDFPDLKRSREFFRDNQDSFTLNERRTRENSDSGTFYVEESIQSGYLMGSFERGPLRVLAGYRVEETTIEYEGREVLIDASGSYQETNPIVGERSYSNGFPALYLRYKWNPRITLIGSLTYTIQRPNFGDVVPRRNVNLENQDLSEGNPELDPTRYTNYDFSIDWRLFDKSLLTLEGFYKQVEDLVFPLESKVESGTYAGFDRNRMENSGAGDTMGFQITWDQYLDGIPLLPDGFAFNLQYHYEQSDVDYPGRLGESLPFAGTPESVVELTVRYRKGPWYGHIRASYSGDELVQVDDNYEEDQYKLGHTMVDLNFNYQLSERLRLDFEFNNLLNSPVHHTYEGIESRRSAYQTRTWNTQISLLFQM